MNAGTLKRYHDHKNKYVLVITKISGNKLVLSSIKML